MLTLNSILKISKLGVIYDGGFWVRKLQSILYSLHDIYFGIAQLGIIELLCVLFSKKYCSNPRTQVFQCNWSRYNYFKFESSDHPLEITLLVKTDLAKLIHKAE